MELSNFLKAINEEECCATCRFFKSEGIVFSIKSSFSNATNCVHLEGNCKRFPPTLVQLETAKSEAVYHWPTIDMQISEFVGEEDHFFDISSDRLLDDGIPWCGEYKLCKDIEYEIYKD
jgi:hypothetical protein